MNQQISKSIVTVGQDEYSDVSMAKVSPVCVELYPAVCKTISLSLEELRGVVREIEYLDETPHITDKDGYSINVYKNTPDDWYPCLPGDLVSVTMLPDNSFGNKYRICIWGRDDCGLEKLYLTEERALTEYMQLIGGETVNKDDLISRGFITA